MPDSGYIRKSTARNIIVGIFIFFLLALGGGLQLVKKQAQDYAVAQATKQGNQTTCVSTVILSRLKASADQAAGDLTTSESQRARARASSDFEELLLSHLKPIPPSINCYLLLGLPEPKENK